MGRRRAGRTRISGGRGFDLLRDAGPQGARDKLLTRLRTEDASLVLFEVPPDERDILIETDPKLFHTTPHYDGSPTILARLAALDPATTRSFLDRRWRRIAPKRAIALRGESRCATGRIALHDGKPVRSR